MNHQPKTFDEILYEINNLTAENFDSTFKAIELMDSLRDRGVIVATNIIIDYPVITNKQDGTTAIEIRHNMDIEWLNNHFDYWSWNPYFDGKWDRENAEKRFRYYLSRDTDSK